MGGAFLTSTGDLFSLSVVVALLIGTLVGLVGGLLPGLSGVTVLTVLIPFVYHMSTLEALALLLSAYAVFTITGDITTTLVGIPSHPECAALVMDGYPMTRRGEGARALGASIASCGIGALIGAVLLA
ncbi:MAG TPA: tripartite tricarboxylate transporter permease, partial [Micromonosporaceae bacterium]